MEKRRFKERKEFINFLYEERERIRKINNEWRNLNFGNIEVKEIMEGLIYDSKGMEVLLRNIEEKILFLYDREREERGENKKYGRCIKWKEKELRKKRRK